MRGVSCGNMKSDRVATTTAVTFIVAFAPVLCVLAQAEGQSIDADCSGKKQGPQNFDVKKENTTLNLNCGAEHKGHVKPAFSNEKFKVCTDKTCSTEPPLSTLINGAKGTMKTAETATIEIKQLPPDEQTFYVQCGETGSNPCYIVVHVASSKPGGATSGGTLSCANAGKAITIKIPEKGSTAQFTCGELTLYPLAKDRVFAEDCKKEESLKNIVRSAEGRVYTLTADKKPPKKKWCYLCASSSVTSSRPGQASDYCVVHVESSSRTQSSTATALAAMLPCVLTMLHIT